MWGLRINLFHLDLALHISVLLEFYEKQKRKPHPATRDEDLKELLSIRDEYVEKNGISKEKCEDDLFE